MSQKPELFLKFVHDFGTIFIMKSLLTAQIIIHIRMILTQCNMVYIYNKILQKKCLCLGSFFYSCASKLTNNAYIFFEVCFCSVLSNKIYFIVCMELVNDFFIFLQNECKRVVKCFVADEKRLNVIEKV